VPSDPLPNPFEYGAVYRVRTDFEAPRDRFVAGDVLMYWCFGKSVYDGMQGYFFRQGDSERVRSWDISLGGDPSGWVQHFELVSPPDPLIAAAQRNDIAALEAALADDGPDDDPLWQLSFELALEAAADQGAARVVTRLMERPVSDALRQRVFMSAASAGRGATLRAMLDAGTAVDLRDGAGQQALTHAACSGDLAAVQLLLARGADPSHINPSGTTALSLARARKHDAVVAALEKALDTSEVPRPG